MTIESPITYLRTGRFVRGSGIVLGTFEGGNLKVKPSRADWGAIIVTPQEIEAGKEKPPLVPRAKKTDEDPPEKREKKPKPPKLPRWKELVAEVRMLELSQSLNIGVTVKIGFLSELADELEASQTLFQPAQ